MAKIKLKISEVYQLNQELLGIQNQETGERVSNGILSAELSLVTKFKLTDLVSNISKYVESVDNLRNGLVEQYGELNQETGQKVLSFFIKDKDGNEIFNPSMEKFNKEMEDLYVQEVEVDVFDIRIEDLDFKTNEIYPIMFDVIKKLSALES